MLVNGTKLKIEKWISKHPSNPIKIGKRKNREKTKTLFMKVELPYQILGNLDFADYI